MPKSTSTTLYYLLFANTAVELGCGFCLLFAPKLLTGSTKTPTDHANLWAGGDAIVAFGRGAGAIAICSLGILSAHALANWPQTPPVATLSALSFYHCAASIVVVPVLGFNRHELQLPAAVIHPLLGLGLGLHAMLGPEEI